jgi:hypothetical protein
MGLMPDPKVARFFGVCMKTIERWSDDPKLNFPPRITINNRSYRSTEALDAFVAGRLKESVVAERAKRRRDDQDQPAAEAT